MIDKRALYREGYEMQGKEFELGTFTQQVNAMKAEGRVFEDGELVEIAQGWNDAVRDETDVDSYMFDAEEDDHDE